ncbi:hypothetical protein [Chryseobacterium sp. Leaf180]|uniref:hypothetical protein n=1 Tax=Chryseobacterium sp. Leaf180 TaxID=1736289 RepID=UPI0012FE9F29|nr:hypothetical protein [Chryseobacterium sp. Leaf180]
MKRQGEKVIPDFIEDDFISAFETGLNRTFYYQDKYIEISRISQSEEYELGYDGVLTTIVPFYIQFKRSDFYTPNFSGKLLTDRAHISLPVDKGFFAFDLLKKKDNFGQHNAMFRLSQVAKAVYVAPLFFKKADLTKMKNYAYEYIPVYYNDIDIFDSHLRRHHNFRNVLLFKNAITIPPHAEVTDDETSHHYSYCRQSKVGFHSEALNLDDSKSETVYYFIQNIFKQEKRYNEINSQVESIFNLLPGFFELEIHSKEFDNILEASINRVSIIDNDTNIKLLKDKLGLLDKLLVIEDILFHYFGIKQFIKFEH